MCVHVQIHVWDLIGGGGEVKSAFLNISSLYHEAGSLIEYGAHDSATLVNPRS